MSHSRSVAVSFVVLACALSGPLLLAQDATRSVQEELRRRSLYFGNVDGCDSGELREATKRYQRRKGFASTGKADRETLRSLGLVPRSPNEPPKELDWPAEPVLPSDETIDTVALAESLSQETGIAAESMVSKKLASQHGLTSRRRQSKNHSAAPGVDESQTRRADSPFVSAPELARFASDYFRAMSSNDIKRQLRFYADKVGYYYNGEIDRRIVEQTLRNYHVRWPSRSYRMGNLIQYTRLPERGEIAMTFPVSFTLRDGRRTVKGETENRLVIRAATVDPRITSISERRVRR